MMAPSAAVGSGASSGVRKSRKMMVQRGGDQPDPLRFAAHLIVDGRARGAERRRKPHQETRADIGHAEGHEFLVGVDLLAVFRRKDARGEDLIGINQDRERQGGRQQRKDI